MKRAHDKGKRALNKRQVSLSSGNWGIDTQFFKPI